MVGKARVPLYLAYLEKSKGASERHGPPVIAHHRGCEALGINKCFHSLNNAPSYNSQLKIHNSQPITQTLKHNNQKLKTQHPRPSCLNHTMTNPSSRTASHEIAKTSVIAPDPNGSKTPSMAILLVHHPVHAHNTYQHDSFLTHRRIRSLTRSQISKQISAAR